MRVAIVNDVPMAAEMLRRVVSRMSGYEIAWIARDGAEAVRKCATDNPDLILMDLIMPVMDGVEATRLIMERSPCAILIVTATVEGNSAKVVEALAVGALDAVETPSHDLGGQTTNTGALINKIEAISKLIFGNANRKQSEPSAFALSDAWLQTPPLVVIGASAGGPGALASILKVLPGDFPASVVIVQHIDAQFAPSLAEWLNDQSVLTVRTAREGDEPRAATVLIASTNDHLVFLNRRKLGYIREPLDSHYRPSIDVFFESVVRHWRGGVTGVLLTGMGRDGARGLKELRQAKALTVAQDAGSCVVYGMPKAAADLGAASRILPLEAIASCLVDSISLTRPATRA
ncbi:MAG: chemotaxis response regulator protein-glutamate methylesterase [Candidatus Acidiferrales bacterium]